MTGTLASSLRGLSLLPLILSAPSLTHATSSSSSSEPPPRLECRPPGPVVPRPRGVTSHPIFQAAAKNLTDSIEAAIAGGDDMAGWPVGNVSFSLGVVAWDDGEYYSPGYDQDDVDDAVDNSNGKVPPGWQLHHLASNNTQGTKSIDADSQYLIGSVSKVFSDYLLLVSGVDLNAKVVDFLPDLLPSGDDSKGNEGNDDDSDGDTPRIRWEDITLRMLGDHMSGIPPNYGFSEYYYLKDYFESLGFPPIGDSEYPPCGVIGLNGDCSQEELLKNMRISPPVANPETRPVYSNTAFTLFVYALSTVNSNKNYTELLLDLVTGPDALNLPSTYPSPGNTSLAVIPPVDNSWGSDYGDNAPQGGLVSTLTDLSAFFRGVLGASVINNNNDTEKLLFDGDKTRLHSWLKPSGMSTGSKYTSVGLPWEIYRADTAAGISPSHPRTLDIYGKGGSAYGYQAQVGMIDELGVGLILMTAGSAEACTYIYEAALATLVPAVDEVARLQAGEMYGGEFRSSGSDTEDQDQDQGEEKETETTMVNATITQDSSSLLLSSLYRDGTDMLASYNELWAVTMGPFFGQTPGMARLFPVDGLQVTTTDESTNGTVVREDWRIEWEMQSASANKHTSLPGAGPEKGVTKDNCLSWTTLDWLHYGGEALDRVVFVKDAGTGKVLGLEVPYLRAGLLGKI